MSHLMGSSLGAVKSSVKDTSLLYTDILVRGKVHQCYHWILTWADYRYSALALFVLAFSEASFFPIPPDLLLIALCLGKSKRSFYYSSICAAASVLGGIFGYALGMFLWSSIESFAFEYLISQEKFHYVQLLFQNNTFWTTFIAGYTPIPYKVFTLTGGAFEVPFLPFVGGSLVGRTMRFMIVGGIIYRLGDRAKLFIDQYLNRVILATSILLVLGFIMIKVWW